MLAFRFCDLKIFSRRVLYFWFSKIDLYYFRSKRHVKGTYNLCYFQKQTVNVNVRMKQRREKIPQCIIDLRELRETSQLCINTKTDGLRYS